MRCQWDRSPCASRNKIAVEAGRPSTSRESRKVKRLDHLGGGQHSHALLESVLACPNLGKYLGGWLPSHADAGGDLRAIRAQERVGQLLLADGDRDCRLAVRNLPLCLSLARGQRFVARLYGARKLDVCKGVFMSAIDLGVVRQVAQFHE